MNVAAADETRAAMEELYADALEIYERARERAGRPDLMLETLVLDESKPYHRSFAANAAHVARDRMAEYARRHR